MSSIKQVANGCQLNDKVLRWQLGDTSNTERLLDNLQLDYLQVHLQIIGVTQIRNANWCMDLIQ